MTHAAQPLKPAAEGGTRRDFLYLTAGATAAMGTMAALWPFIDSLNPAGDVIAAGQPIEIDLARIEPAQQITVLWRGHPVFLLHRTPAELKRLQQPDENARLRDPQSQVHQQPPYAENWHRSIKPEYLVVVGICTHLGCIPHFTPADHQYYCPCHGSRYDLAARVFKGVPAPYNLPVPPHRFVNATLVRIGENPPGVRFDFGSIVQI